MFPFAALMTFPDDVYVNKEEDLHPHEACFHEDCCPNAGTTEDVVLHSAAHLLLAHDTVSAQDEDVVRKKVYAFLHSPESAAFHAKRAGFMKYTQWKNVNAFRRSILAYTLFDDPLCLYALAWSNSWHVAVIYRHSVWNTCAHAKGIGGATLLFEMTAAGLKPCMRRVKSELLKVQHLPLRSRDVRRMASATKTAAEAQSSPEIVTPAVDDSTCVVGTPAQVDEPCSDTEVVTPAEVMQAANVVTPNVDVEEAGSQNSDCASATTDDEEVDVGVACVKEELQALKVKMNFRKPARRTLGRTRSATRGARTVTPVDTVDEGEVKGRGRTWAAPVSSALVSSVQRIDHHRTRSATVSCATVSSAPVSSPSVSSVGHVQCRRTRSATVSTAPVSSSTVSSATVSSVEHGDRRRMRSATVSSSPVSSATVSSVEHVQHRRTRSATVSTAPVSSAASVQHVVRDRMRSARVSSVASESVSKSGRKRDASTEEDDIPLSVLRKRLRVSSASKTRILSDVCKKTTMLKRRRKQCRHCTFKCSGQGLLNSHLRTKHNMHPCSVAYCESYWVSKSAAEIHRTTHVLKQYKCSDCGRIFKHKHVKDRHPCSAKPAEFKCSRCDKVFRWPQDLKEHECVHTRKKFHCSFCKRTFHSQKYVVMHEHVHRDPRVECKIYVL